MDDMLRSYNASGSLRYPDNTSMGCDVTITQDHDGQLGLQYAGLRPGRAPHARLIGHVVPIRFEGQTTDGRPVSLAGAFRPLDRHWNASDGTREAFEVIGTKGSPVTLEVGAQLGHSEGEWRFGLTNLLFESPVGTIYPDGSADRGVMALQLGSAAVRLEQCGHYAQAERDLARRRKIRVTAEICIPAAIGSHQAQEIATDVCALLSIAHGTLINWLYCDRISTKTAVPDHSFHRDGTTRPYSGALPLIGPTVEGDLPAFLQATFVPFADKRDEWRLRAFSSAYADIRTTGFLEARCLQAGCLIDFITGKEAAIAGDSSVIDKEEYEGQIGRLCPALQRMLMLAFPTLELRTANEMAQRARYWHYRSFMEKIVRTAQRLGVVVRKDQTKPVVSTRNELAHRMQFQDEATSFEELAGTLALLDQLVMGLLQYRGPYVNALTFDRVDPATSSVSSAPGLSTPP